MSEYISPKMRFTILNRDGFRCKYCGRSAEETKLEVDHIIPVARGGKSVEENLITACMECNRGKSAVPLRPSSAHWTQMEKIGPFLLGRCSACGYQTELHVKPNFCPVCGAKMNMEEEQ